MVWNALAKGYRLGTTSSSDHGSTHISYSLVYTPENDRKAILDAIASDLVGKAVSVSLIMKEQSISNATPSVQSATPVRSSSARTAA
jgi:hypothetical protein